MKNQKPKTCVIYCRVSSKKQAQEGDSLKKQARQCSEEAKRRGLKVVHVPFEEPFTGRAESRPVFDDMLSYLIQNKDKVGYLLFLEIGRASRGGNDGYTGFDKAIRGLGVEIIDVFGIIQPEKNLLEEYGDIANYSWAKQRPSKASELVYAEMKQQEVNTMLVRLIGSEIDLTQQGYWIGTYPYGFVTKKQKGMKKRTILVPDESEAPFIREIFQLRAEGILNDAQIVDKVNKLGYRSRVRNKWDKLGVKVVGKTGGKKLEVEQMKKYLEMPIYAGIMKKKWTHELPIKAQFDGLISLEIWNKANKGRVYIEDLGNDEYQWIKNFDEGKRVKTKVSSEYPYKHVIKCPLCRKNFWASASTGKSGQKFPKYHCTGMFKKKSTHTQYSVPADEFNKTIEDFVKGLTFTNDYREGFELVMKDVYQKKHKEQIKTSKDIARTIQDKRTELETLYEKLERATKEIVERRLEEKIENLDTEIKKLEKERNQSEATEHDFMSYLKHALHLLAHPGEILLKPRKKEEQQAIWSLVFEELPTYEEIKTGTPKLSLCFNVKSTSKSASHDVVGDKGLEPLTYPV